ncbi:MAG TPA: hypothetical protein VGG83_10700 [Trebonia sp.]|jgi:hypothetical protein
MARYRIEATWDDDGVRLQYGRATRIPPEHEARMRERGMLGPDDEPVSIQQLGQSHITDKAQMTNKHVRRTALAWLAEHAGMTDADSYEMQLAVRSHLEALGRLEASTAGH